MKAIINAILNIALPVILVCLLLTFSSSIVKAQACEGYVTDSNTGNGINGVTVAIHFDQEYCPNEPDVVETTSDGFGTPGYWYTQSPGFTCSIASVRFSASGYSTRTITHTGIQACLSCTDPYCTWSGGNPSSIQLQPNTSGAQGYTCADPGSIDPDTSCPLVSCDPSSQSNCYSTQNACLNVCVLSLTPVPPPTCISEGEYCNDALGDPIGTCCSGLECNTPDPYGDPFLVCGSATSSPTPATTVGGEGQPCRNTNPFCNSPFVCSNGYCVTPKNAQCGSHCDNPNRRFGHCHSGSVHQLPSNYCERPTDEDGVGLDEDGSIDCSLGSSGDSQCGDCWCCEYNYPPDINSCDVPRITVTIPPRSSGCDAYGNCVLCAEGYINTAIGCIPVGDRQRFLEFILRWAIGVSSGVSFLMIVYSGVLIMTAQGDKQRLQTGKEFLTASVAGLMMIIFSVFILQFIGIELFRIPGL